MQNVLPASAWVSIAIAFAGLIVVPVGVHLIKQFLRALQRAKAAELAAALAPYMTKIEHETRADRVDRESKEWRAEQRELLDTIRSESYQRETLMVDRLDKLNTRLDQVFTGGGRPRHSGQNR